MGDSALYIGKRELIQHDAIDAYGQSFRELGKILDLHFQQELRMMRAPARTAACQRPGGGDMVFLDQDGIETRPKRVVAAAAATVTGVFLRRAQAREGLCAYPG